MTAQEAIAKDYMGIIRSHVRSYVGKTDDAANNQTQKSTNYNQQNNTEENNQQQQGQENQKKQGLRSKIKAGAQKVANKAKNKK